MTTDTHSLPDTKTPRASITDPATRLNARTEPRGLFEPPRGFVVMAIARHKLLIAIVAVATAMLGVGYGLLRKPNYTAAATLQVGQVNPNSPGFYGYVQSAAALAGAFSRAIDAEPVLDVVQRKLHLTPAAAAARLSSEPIPVSPAFRVIATGPSAAAAIELANVTAAGITEYETHSNGTGGEAEALLHEYAEASFALQNATQSFSTAQRNRRTSAQQLARSAADRTAAEVKLKAIGNSYVSAVASQAPSAGLVSLLAGAAGASSDRRAKIEMLGLIGLLAGLVLGSSFAMARQLPARRTGNPSNPEAELPVSPWR
jgi:capsular polysaccharide biosynthesis protein